VSEAGRSDPRPPKMNAARARAVLKQELRFADPVQCEALRYLNALGLARLRLMSCKKCDGVGRVVELGGSCRSVCECVAGESAEMLRDLGV